TTGRKRNKPQRLRDDPNYRSNVEMSLEPNPSSSESEAEGETDDVYDTDGLPVDSDDLDSSDDSSAYNPRARDDNLRDKADTDKSAQEAYDQDQIYLKQLLSLPQDYHYTVADLEHEEIHERALRLLYRARFGQEHDISSKSPHIKYNHLPKSVPEAIKTRIQVRDSEVLYYAQMVKDGKATQAAVTKKEKARAKVSGEAPGEGSKKRAAATPGSASAGTRSSKKGKSRRADPGGEDGGEISSDDDNFEDSMEGDGGGVGLGIS
ncbi:MAG: hypothetical protein Q9226_008238, partial [Calogaya cf. arnoldii]